MKNNKKLLIEALQTPEQLLKINLKEWEAVLSHAQAANLLARLCYLLEKQSILKRIPERPRNHLLSAKIISDKQNQLVKWEAYQLTKAFNKTGYPFIFLKGAAYVVTENSAHHGRIFTDIDILVPKEGLLAAEKVLMMHGWFSTHHSAYDEKYYRTWMHELPPLQHIQRQSVLDVHHNILPTTAKLHPDPKKLIHNAISIDSLTNNNSENYTLSHVDMVLHSATHLFSDGELEHGLRDLVDLDSLLNEFGSDTDFWKKLIIRAGEMDLGRPLFYALRYCKKIMGTSIPDATEQDSRQYKPLFLPLMDLLFKRALMPDHPDYNDGFTGTARWMLYVRSHYLRMPFHLLIPHLLHKSIITPWKERKEEEKKKETVDI